jgi:hypothetical protein
VREAAARIRLALLIGALAAFALLAPAASQAKPKAHKAASPTQLIAALIGLHNAVGTQLQDEYIGPNSVYSGTLEGCHQVELASGETRESGEVTLREEAKRLAALSEEVYAEYNQQLPASIARIRAAKAGLPRAKRARLTHALALLDKGHSGHAPETFHLHGIWVDMEAVRCADTETEFSEAEEVGSVAWTAESSGLRQLAALFGVTGPVEFPFGPYLSV